jgi:structural maintenance of chromosome 1
MSAKLHRLELNNFKSYQGKVVVGPFQDFTCIVGPNGSGKSNLMDALSFALGSSATALRGTKPEDLINRKAKKTEASVSIVMRQPNGHEMALTRNIGAKGAVTTAVDGMAVSEKEFGAVLRKCRIGARLSTFLVFQHEVEAVAQKSAKELTEMIEFVSGSGDLRLDYLAKKRALDAANEQLASASVDKRGALAEVQQMRLHKKEAEKYTEVHARLVAERRDLALSELFHLETQLARQKREMARHGAEADKLKGMVTTDDEVRRQKKDYSAKHKAYLEEIAKGRKSNNEHREQRGTLDRIKVSLEHFERKLVREQQELSASERTSDVRSKETARFGEQLTQQEALLATHEAQWAKEDREHAAQHNMTAAEATEYKGLRKDADCQTITKRQELETLRRNRDGINDAAKQAQMQADNAEATKKELDANVRRNTDKAQAAAVRIAEGKKLVAEVTGEKDQAAASLTQMKAKGKERDEQLQLLDSQLKELRFEKETNRHEARVAEALLALKSMHGGIRGRLVDLCTIPNPRHRIAVTVALGKNLEAIVVDTTETAMACVRYLKEQRIASLSFIPLNAAQGKAVDDSLRVMGGTCKPIVDVIKYDASLEPAMRYALGRALVCDAMDEARRVAYEGGERHKVVTLDGSVLLKNGAVQGGLAAVQSRAKKWDEQRHTKLRAAREALISEGVGASEAEEARVLCSVKELESRATYQGHKVARDETEIKQLGEKSKKLKEEAARLEAQAKTMAKRQADLAEHVRGVEKKMLALQKDVAAVENGVFGAFQKRVGIDNIAEMEQRTATQARQRAERRQKLAVVIHKLKAAMQGEGAAATAGKSADAIKGAVKQTEKELTTCKRDLEKYAAVVDVAAKALKRIQENVAASKAELDRMEAALRNNSKASESEVRKLAAARKAVTMLQSACEAIRQKRLSLFQRCRMEQTELPTVADGAASKKRGRAGDEDEDDDEDGDAPLRLEKSEAFTSLSETEKGRKEAPLCIDFTALDRKLRRAAADKEHFAAFKSRTTTVVDQLERELESIAPNLKATSKFSSSEAKLGDVATTVDGAREASRRALMDFTAVKEQRVLRFMSTFEKIGEHVDEVYRDLTLGTRADGIHGCAYLTLEDAEEPYNAGTRYHATPPMKRFMAMELLSGGERTMAALALLFAIHATSPTAFFVLDEVDAALDAGNVTKLAQFLRNHASGCQYVVVSLKDQLYHIADTLVGVYKDVARESSGTLTLDLRKTVA